MPTRHLKLVRILVIEDQIDGTKRSNLRSRVPSGSNRTKITVKAAWTQSDCCKSLGVERTKS